MKRKCLTHLLRFRPIHLYLKMSPRLLKLSEILLVAKVHLTVKSILHYPLKGQIIDTFCAVLVSVKGKAGIYVVITAYPNSTVQLLIIQVLKGVHTQQVSQITIKAGPANYLLCIGVSRLFSDGRCHGKR